MKDRRATRLDLAEWIASRDNPLTARVFVNRLWKVMFGQGIVGRPAISAPRATSRPIPSCSIGWRCEFMDSGWDVKHLLKLMALSSAYRQSSTAGKELAERDPTNVWLDRQNRYPARRRDGAGQRPGDQRSAVSEIGGGSVKPYQPAGYWSYLNFPSANGTTTRAKASTAAACTPTGAAPSCNRAWPHSTRPCARNAPSSGPRSSTPLQALVLLDDPTYVEAARVFAERIVREGGPVPASRLSWAYRRALSAKSGRRSGLCS